MLVRVGTDGSLPSSIPLSAANVVVGRSRECDVVLDASCISKEQASLKMTGRVCSFTAGSNTTNLSVVDGAVIAKGQTVTLADGAVILFGGYSKACETITNKGSPWPVTYTYREAALQAVDILSSPVTSVQAAAGFAPTVQPLAVGEGPVCYDLIKKTLVNALLDGSLATSAEPAHIMRYLSSKGLAFLTPSSACTDDTPSLHLAYRPATKRPRLMEVPAEEEGVPSSTGAPVPLSLSLQCSALAANIDSVNNGILESLSSPELLSPPAGDGDSEGACSVCL